LNYSVDQPTAAFNFVEVFLVQDTVKEEEEVDVA
jgi:hypothetical protein